MALLKDKKSDYVDTHIGKFNIGLPINDFICRELPMCKHDDETVIKSCLTRVRLICKDDTEWLIEPVSMEGCMNPGEKTVVPITFRCQYDNRRNIVNYEISTRYKGVMVRCTDINDKTQMEIPKSYGGSDRNTECYSYYTSEDIKSIYTEDYEPHIKVLSCKVCRNCGRC